MDIWGPILTAMVTPFTAQGAVDRAGTARLARHLVDHGSDGLVVGATTGEGAVLSPAERLELWDTVLGAVGDRAAVWAATGTSSTEATREASRAAASVGVHGLLVVTPYYVRPPQAGLYAHYAAVAEAVDLPVMVYNVPSRTGVQIHPDTVLQLARDIPTIQGIKEAHGDCGQIADLIRGREPGFRVLSGDDAVTFPLLALGGDGVVSVASHVVGPELQEMVQAMRRGETARAAGIHLRLLPLIRALFTTTNPIPVKAALAMCGHPVGGVRLPLSPPSQEEAAVVRSALHGLGLLPEGDRVVEVEGQAAG